MPALRGIFVLAVTSLPLLTGCSTNPATGKKQLNFYSEQAEINIGRQNDQALVNQLGLYPDDALQAYVQNLGAALAAESERPHLPWTFRVVDDPVVNAFALPGGFIYITRGILSHLGSEAELAGVLGHEIGHVTARHGVNQMSKAQLAQAGLIAGMIAAPEAADQIAGLGQSGLGLLFLKFGRDDERQADELGFRYMSREQYPPGALSQVFDTLARVGDAAGAQRLPGWMSTHPAPENRSQLTAQRLASAPPELISAPWRKNPYLDRIDGIVFGNDPRQGYFRGSTFYHPDLAFELDFPDGWKYQNTRQAVVAMSPGQDAMVMLELAQQSDLPSAAAAFRQINGVELAGQRFVNNRAGLDTLSDRFRLLDANRAEQIRGGVAFTEHAGRVYRLIGIAKPNSWNGYQSTVANALASFSRVTDRRVLEVEPRRLEIVRIDRSMTLEQFRQRYNSSITLDELALINQVDRDARLEPGQRVKRIVGKDPSQ